MLQKLKPVASQARCWHAQLHSARGNARHRGQGYGVRFADTDPRHGPLPLQTNVAPAEDPTIGKRLLCCTVNTMPNQTPAARKGVPWGRNGEGLDQARTLRKRELLCTKEADAGGSLPRGDRYPYRSGPRS